MIRRQPRSTRTDTLFPYTTLFRSHKEQLDGMMVGDSFANHFTGMVDILAKPNGIRLMDYTLDACTPIFGYAAEVSAAYGERCVARNARELELIKQKHYPYVVLARAWHRDAAAAQITKGSLTSGNGKGTGGNYINKA